MRRDNQHILITLDEWMQAGLSLYDYKNDKHSGYLKTIGRGCNGRCVEIIWGSIVKEDRKSAIREKLGDPEKVCSVKWLESRIETDAKARDFFHHHIKPDGSYLSEKRCNELIANAEVMNAIIEVAGEQIGKKRSLNGSVNKVWENLARAANLLTETYGHNLPAEPRRLKEKIKKYTDLTPNPSPMERGTEMNYASLLHGNEGNKYAARVDDDLKEAAILKLLKHNNNLDNVQIADMYNGLCKVYGWKTISDSTVNVWRRKFDLPVYLGTHGETAFCNTRTMQQKRTRPTHPLYYWTMDGWVVELLYKKTETVETIKKNPVQRQDDDTIYSEVSYVDGKTVTTYFNRLTAVIVLDPFCNYPIGYAIGKNESNELIREALRNALRHTEELFGSMYRPHQLQSDNYHIGSLKELYGIVADKVTPARVKNAKSKVIEPYNYYLNKNHCQYKKNWSGFGLTSNKDSQPNKDAINKMRHYFPDEAGCREQIEEMFKKERGDKLAAYLQQWDKVADSDRLKMDDATYLLTFGEHTEKPILLQGSGILPTIKGIKRTYDCFDLKFREHYGVHWYTYYDPADMSKALAVNEEKTLRFMLQEKYIQPMALKDRKDGDAEAKKRVEDYNKALLESTKAQMAKADALFEELPMGLLLPEAEILEKFCLVDSNGQHKDQRSRLREKLVTVEAINGYQDYKTISPSPLTPKGGTLEMEEAEEADIYAMM